MPSPAVTACQALRRDFSFGVGVGAAFPLPMAGVSSISPIFEINLHQFDFSFFCEVCKSKLVSVLWLPFNKISFKLRTEAFEVGSTPTTLHSKSSSFNKYSKKKKSQSIPFTSIHS